MVDLDDQKTITTGFGGLTEVLNDANNRTEKRTSNRSKSYSEPSCVSLNKKKRKILFPVIK